MKKAIKPFLAMVLLLLLLAVSYIGVNLALEVGEYAIERRARDYLENKYGGKRYQHGPLRLKNGKFEVDFYFEDPLVGGTDITVVMDGFTVVSDNYYWAWQQNSQNN
ncbi:MAG: hypothetical protein IJR59_02475 [Firmicutes bacterium]|nr:hypothetical protein [Bacillota bacterium]